MPFEDYSQEEKLSALKLLLHLAAADNKQNVNEMLFLRDIAERMGISVSELAGLDETDRYSKLELPAAEGERVTIFYHLLYMMKMDHEVSEEEMSLCRQTGFRLGIRDEMATELVHLVARNADTRIPDDILLETVIKYMN